MKPQVILPNKNVAEKC